ncbi:MAG: hypothetical protein ACXWUG_11795 [Polyangiales bacterium]
MPVAPGEAREQDGVFVVTALVQDAEMRVLHREEIAVPLEMIARARSRRETLIEAMHRLVMERAYFHAERLRRERPEDGI